MTKANLPVAKAFLLAMFAGAFIAFGGLFFTVFLSDSTLAGVPSAPWAVCAFAWAWCWYWCAAPSCLPVIRLWSARSRAKRSPWLRCSRHGSSCGSAIFVGALFIVFLVYMAGIYKLNGEAVANSMVSVAAGKVTIDWVTIFFRGILCNIFVCLAVWIGTAGKTVVDKVVAFCCPSPLLWPAV